MPATRWSTGKQAQHLQKKKPIRDISSCIHERQRDVDVAQEFESHPRQSAANCNNCNNSQFRQILAPGSVSTMNMRPCFRFAGSYSASLLLLLFIKGGSSFCPQGSQPLVFSTSSLAGSGERGREDGVGSEASFRHPEGLLPSLDGKTVYVADRHNDWIRAVDLESQTVTTVAGSGRGFVNGPLHQAQFHQPIHLAFLTPSQLAVADSINNRIRLIDLISGQVSTLAGDGSTGFEDGAASGASFSLPTAVAALPDGSGVVVADTTNYRIRVVWMDGWAAGFEGPYVTTLAGGGPRQIPYKGDLDGAGSEAQFAYPRGLAVTPDGSTVVVADSENHKIRLVSVGTGRVTTLSGSGTKGSMDGSALSTSFRWPFAVQVHDSGEAVVVVDTDNHALRVVSLRTGRSSTLMDSAAGVVRPRGVAVLPGGRGIVVAGSEKHVLHRLTALNCSACANPIPSSAEYSALALPGECGWECTRGSYKTDGGCAACDEAPARQGSSCPSGYRLDRGWECAGLGEALGCVQCPWERCGVEGLYRTNCSDERPEGSCVPCTRKPSLARFTSSGTPQLVDDCAWECFVGYYIANADGSTVDPNATKVTEPKCVPCSNKPDNAIYTSSGLIPARDTCQWTCQPQFVLVQNGTSCWPFLSFLATLETTEAHFFAVHAPRYLRAVALTADVPVAHVKIGTVEKLRRAGGSRQLLQLYTVDTPRLSVETVVAVESDRMLAAYRSLSAQSLRERLSNLTVVQIDLRRLEAALPPPPADVDPSSLPEDSRTRVVVAATVCVAVVGAVCVGATACLALRTLRRGRKGGDRAALHTPKHLPLSSSPAPTNDLEAAGMGLIVRAALPCSGEEEVDGATTAIGSTPGAAAAMTAPLRPVEPDDSDSRCRCDRCEFNCAGCGAESLG